MNDIPADLIYNPKELDKWLDSSPPLSDDEMKAMSAYFQLPKTRLYVII